MVNMKILKVVVGPVMTNCYIVYHGNTREGFIVDPGDEPERLAEAIAGENLNLKAILLTHGHFDHILGVPELKKRFDVPVYAHEEEKLLLGDSDINLSGKWRKMPTTFAADRYLEDGEEFTLAGFPMKAIHTPGHTIGGVCYYAAEEKVLFSGDTLFCESYGRTDLPTGSASEIERSINEKLLVLPEDVAVCPGHSEGTSIGHERKYNPLSKKGPAFKQ